MPRPQHEPVTFTLDGREVTAPQNSILADAALQHGDVEIPVFCYEPKLGAPVGACRMCLVEIEGVPKLQAGCSVLVKDGMVVSTNSPRVKEAQEAVLEFILVNHPLDCPVCDKGGECPLQDKSFGWGGGISRFVEPKRHFEKPLALSPLIAIDRERCILCYRCVRFSQEIAEDHQLVLQERGAGTYVATFDGHPYVAPFSGNIIELCPVGALTSRPYRFRARPWDIEQAGSICTLCPSQCNVSFTVRDDRVLRVLQRDNEGVDDGWLCDKGRFAYQAIHADERITEPLIRDGGELRPAGWDVALERAGDALAKAGERLGALAGGETTNEEGFLLQRLVREVAGSPHVDSRPGGALPLGVRRALAALGAQASVPDLEFAHAVLVLDAEPVDDAPILDLRLRKGVRRGGVKLFVATSRPSSLDERAQQSVRIAPGGGEAFLAALDAALAGGDVDGPAGAAGLDAHAVRLLATGLREAGEDVVILWGERLVHGERGAHAARALLNVAARLGLIDRPGAGLLEIPSGANGRGLAEAGVLPNAGPGYAEAPAGRDAAAIAEGLAAGELTTLHLLHVDPLLDLPGRAAWERALEQATTVVAHAAFLTEGIREHATVVFPATSYAEKEGTVVHPDGRLQRLRRAIGRQGQTRDEWQVLADLARRAGGDLGVLTASMATQQLVAAVPFYAGLTLDEIGGRGVRWVEREAAAALPAGDAGPFALEAPPAVPAANGRLRLGTFRSIWAAPEVEVSPALKFLHPRQRVELSPADARRLGIAHGTRLVVGANGHSVSGVAHVRAAAPEGTVFLETAIPQDSAAGLDGPLVEVRPRVTPSLDGVLQTPLAVVGYAEPLYIQIIKSLVIFAVGLQLVPVVLMMERKILGRFQNRYGPNRVGPFGVITPLADILKLLTKEEFRPRTAIAWLFTIAPILSIVAAVASLALIPFGNVQDIFGTPVGLYGIDVSVGPLYVFAFGAIAFYGIMLGGWSSGSKYSFLGSMRAAAQLVSYEVAQGMAIVGVIITAQSMSLTEIVEGQAGMWYVIPQFVAFLIFMVASFAETNRPPFDLVEADAELVGGYMTEYGGGRFALYYFAEYLNVLVISGLATTLFLGGWLLPFGIDAPGWVDPFVVIAKMLIFVLFFIWIRATLPRLRYDQLMSFGWKVLLPLATLNALVTAIVVVAAD